MHIISTPPNPNSPLKRVGYLFFFSAPPRPHLLRACLINQDGCHDNHSAKSENRPGYFRAMTHLLYVNKFSGTTVSDPHYTDIPSGRERTLQARSKSSATNFVTFFSFFLFFFFFFSYAARWKSPSMTAWLHSSGCDFCQFTPQKPRAKCHKFRGRDWWLLFDDFFEFAAQKFCSMSPLRALTHNSWTIEQSLLTHSVINYCFWILGIVFITKR